MKKKVIIFFCILLVSVNSFAEFVISPKIGYSNIFTFEPQGDVEDEKKRNNSQEFVE